jgi:hypothetical protein
MSRYLVSTSTWRSRRWRRFSTRMEASLGTDWSRLASVALDEGRSTTYQANSLGRAGNTRDAAATPETTTTTRSLALTRTKNLSVDKGALAAVERGARIVGATTPDRTALD